MDAVLFILFRLLDLYLLIIFVRVMLTWIPNLDTSNPIIRLLSQITDPVLNLARGLVPPVSGVDLSPMVVILGLILLREVLAGLL